MLNEHTFNDVPKTSWAKGAISAVQSNGIASGTSDGKFEPNKTVTREQYAQFLYNALEYKKRLNENVLPDEKNSSDTNLLKGFQQELKQHIDNREENITITYKTNHNNLQEVMDTLVKEYGKTVDSDEYLKHNVASTKYSIRGIPGNYVFTLNITYRESKEQTQYVKEQEMENRMLGI